jgi:hypothetical protein
VRRLLGERGPHPENLLASRDDPGPRPDFDGACGPATGLRTCLAIGGGVPVGRHRAVRLCNARHLCDLANGLSYGTALDYGRSPFLDPDHDRDIGAEKGCGQKGTACQLQSGASHLADCGSGCADDGPLRRPGGLYPAYRHLSGVFVHVDGFLQEMVSASLSAEPLQGLAGCNGTQRWLKYF